VGAAVAAHVEEIVLTAEREAGIIQRDLEAHRRAAEEQAQRYLEDAKRQAEALVQSRVELVRESRWRETPRAGARRPPPACVPTQPSRWPAGARHQGSQLLDDVFGGGSGEPRTGWTSR
jgi:hypothetical protein